MKNMEFDTPKSAANFPRDAVRLQLQRGSFQRGRPAEYNQFAGEQVARVLLCWFLLHFRELCPESDLFESKYSHMPLSFDVFFPRCLILSHVFI